MKGRRQEYSHGPYRKGRWQEQLDKDFSKYIELHFQAEFPDIFVIKWNETCLKSMPFYTFQEWRNILFIPVLLGYGSIYSDSTEDTGHGQIT